MVMKRKFSRVFSIVCVSVALSAGICLAEFPLSQSALMQGETNLNRKVRLCFFGYLLLPHDYRAYQTDDLQDAWYGYIASPSKKTLRIRYTAGLVESPFQQGKDKFVWLKTESIHKGLLKYGLLKKEHGGQMAATVGIVNFYATLETEAEKDLFLRIVRSYRMEHCQDCEFPLPKSKEALDIDSP